MLLLSLNYNAPICLHFETYFKCTFKVQPLGLIFKCHVHLKIKMYCWHSFNTPSPFRLFPNATVPYCSESTYLCIRLVFHNITLQLFVLQISPPIKITTVNSLRYLTIWQTFCTFPFLNFKSNYSNSPSTFPPLLNSLHQHCREATYTHTQLRS